MSAENNSDIKLCQSSVQKNNSYKIYVGRKCVRPKIMSSYMGRKIFRTYFMSAENLSWTYWTDNNSGFYLQLDIFDFQLEIKSL